MSRPLAGVMSSDVLPLDAVVDHDVAASDPVLEKRPVAAVAFERAESIRPIEPGHRIWPALPGGRRSVQRPAHGLLDLGPQEPGAHAERKHEWHAAIVLDDACRAGNRSPVRRPQTRADRPAMSMALPDLEAGGADHRLDRARAEPPEPLLGDKRAVPVGHRRPECRSRRSLAALLVFIVVTLR